MKLSLRLINAAFLTILLSACATGPESDPAYVSPTQYQDYNCKQIRAEMKRISGKLEQASQSDGTNQVLSAAVTAFAISRGYGFSDDGNAPIKRLHNQYDVLEQTAIQKSCN
jgi:hypothetical protein